MTVVAREMKLNSVGTVTATSEEGVFVLRCNITDIEGNTYDTDYCSRPDDTFGLSPSFRQWLTDNPDFPIQPYIPATADEIRASMPSLTARQLRLGLLNAGISPSQVTAAIDAIPAGLDKDKAQIEWGYATTLSRSHHLIETIGSVLGLVDEQIDAMWMAALDL
jgi:hypothetical protein